MVRSANTSVVSAVPERSAVAHAGVPSGTVSFAFTDIEGSTARWERNPDAMQAAVRRHDEIMRAAIATFGGHVFKTIGDAFCAAFWRPEDAVGAMLSAQRAVAAEDFSAIGGLRVRAAVHTGTADERDGDYFGPVVNRVARLVAIGHGGQILISGVVRSLIRDLPPGVTVIDHGRHRLKDLNAPEHVFELTLSELASPRPPLRSLDADPNNLPVAQTSFVGRAAEIAAITQALATHRLVTLVGAGGIGKTRTSLHVAANLVDGSGDGVWFIEFAPLTDGETIAPTVAQAMGIALGGGTVDALVDALRSKCALLIFDNCEHLIDATARVAGALLRGCPQIVILASSRQALGIAGEYTYRLPSLDVPPRAADAQLTANEAAQSAAVALFVERARAADHRFALSDDNAPVVADICRRLDGIALAIELAAARTRILGPRQLRDRLDERFRVLTGGSRDVLPRQQTLRALIDWSYDLLDVREQTIFGRLGVFVNGFTLEAAVAVAGGDDFDEFDVIDLLTSLVDKSLVLVGDADGDRRYSMLESTRDGADAAALALRHALFFSRTLAQLTAARMYDRQHQMVEAELDNLRAALTWTLHENRDPVLGSTLACDISRFWSMQMPHEGLRWLEIAQSRLADSPDMTLRARIMLAIAAMLPHGSFERIAETERGLEMARASRDKRVLVRALAAFGEQLAPLGRSEEAEAAFTESLALAREIDNGWDVARALSGLATLAAVRDDLVAAHRTFSEALELFTAMGARDGIAYVSISLGDAEFCAGNFESAIELVLRARDVYGELGHHRSSACACNYLAAFALLLGRIEDARANARDALARLDEDRHPLFCAEAIEHLAHVASASGDAERGALLAGYAAAGLAKLAHSRSRHWRDAHEKHMHALVAAFGDEALAAHMAAGALLREDEALAKALAV